jgi:hypothetical protein
MGDQYWSATRTIGSIRAVSRLAQPAFWVWSAPSPYDNADKTAGCTRLSPRNRRIATEMGERKRDGAPRRHRSSRDTPSSGGVEFGNVLRLIVGRVNVPRWRRVPAAAGIWAVNELSKTRSDSRASFRDPSAAAHDAGSIAIGLRYRRLAHKTLRLLQQARGRIRLEVGVEQGAVKHLAAVVRSPIGFLVDLMGLPSRRVYERDSIVVLTRLRPLDGAASGVSPMAPALPTMSQSCLRSTRGATSKRASRDNSVNCEPQRLRSKTWPETACSAKVTAGCKLLMKCRLVAGRQGFEPVGEAKPMPPA